MSKRQSILSSFGFKVRGLDLDDPAADAMATAEPEAEVKRFAPPQAPSEQLNSLDGLDPPYDVGIIGSSHGRKLVAVDRYMVIYTFQLMIVVVQGPVKLRA